MNLWFWHFLYNNTWWNDKVRGLLKLSLKYQLICIPNSSISGMLFPEEADDDEERDCPDDAAPACILSSSLPRLASMACNADLLGPVNTWD